VREHGERARMHATAKNRTIEREIESKGESESED